MPEGAVATPAATPTATPAAPAAAPAAAATPSAPATPVSTPAAVETPTSQPAATPEAQPAAQSGSPATAPGAAGAEPQQSDFEGDVVGFLEAHSTWERQQLGEAVPEVAPVADETKPVEVETKPEGNQEKVADAAPAESITPESLNALTLKSPELKAALDANPEVKNALYAMARINAKAAPILEVFPNVESAKFAADAANTVVGLRTSFLEAVDNPENFRTAYEQFADEFAIKDKDGKPVLDAQGNPEYGDDFHMLNNYIVDAYHDVEIGDLETQLQSGQFASEEALERADMALQALKFIKDWRKDGDAEQKPDLSGLSPEARAYYEQKERELTEREEALGEKGKTQTAEQRKAERTNYETAVAGKVGKSVGSRIQSMMDEKEKVGAFIPSYVLEAKDPGTGISVFAKTLLDKFEEATYGRRDRATGKVIGGVAYIREQAAMLRNRPPSPEAEAARVDFYNKLIDDHFPEIFEKEFRSIQNKEIQDRERRNGKSEVRERVAEREPKAGGSAGTPQPLTPESAMKQAYAWVDENHPDLDGAARTEKALIKKNEIMGGR